MDALYEVSKNSLETIRFNVTEFKGKQYADARAYYRDDDGELKPTRKGLTISPDIWPGFVQGIERVGAELAERGLIEKVEEEAEAPECGLSQG